jgi:chromosome segregation ATPase
VVREDGAGSFGGNEMINGHNCMLNEPRICEDCHSRVKTELAEAKAEIKSITNDYLESSRAQMARYEMQLAEAKAENALIATLKQRVQTIADERDDLRNKLAEAQSEIDCRTLDFARMRDERDKARESLPTKGDFI